MQVYPRVGGGNPAGFLRFCQRMGLSPRGRGKLRQSPAQILAGGSIPAWAGETPARPLGQHLEKVYPRVGGGNRSRSRCARPAPGLSPRGRGKRRKGRFRDNSKGSIPAWAGETGRRAPGFRGGPVYPRVGGGNIVFLQVNDFCIGLSPRGRGKPRSHRPVHIAPRSIPAWAGETGLPALNRPPLSVYPRVGGGNAILGGGFQHLYGSIPAWAGETRAVLATATARRVYPRVGGGNDWCWFGAAGSVGLSPRGRGKL